jgi:hypothetical protein
MGGRMSAHPHWLAVIRTLRLPALEMGRPRVVPSLDKTGIAGTNNSLLTQS